MDTRPTVTTFALLTNDWNAEPNTPDPMIRVEADGIVVTFFLNPFAYSGFREGDKAHLHFARAWRFRMGPPNDEGWYRGQCRFSHLAPRWGELYEVGGDLREQEYQGEWIVGPSPRAPESRHFLFYFRDATFECDASAWRVEFDRQG